MLCLGSKTAHNAIIFLHGYTQTSRDAKFNLSKSISPGLLNNTVIFFPSKKWFEYESENSFEYSRSSLFNSRKYLNELIKKYSQYYKSIKLIGYSQGACMALDVCIHSEIKMPTLIFSGFLMTSDVLKKSGINYTHYKDTQDIFVVHGRNDSIITFEMQQTSLKNITLHKEVILEGADHWGFWEMPEVKTTLKEFLRHEI